MPDSATGLRNFPPGSVGETLSRMNGVWLDRIRVYDPAGVPLAEDALSGTPGASPWENLVYIEFDGEIYRQTNVTCAGRPLHVRSFTGALRHGVLVFDSLGPNDPEHVGVSAGPGVLFLSGSRITPAWQNYAEPDCIRLLSERERTRTTLLYRDGRLVRCLTANGERVARSGAVRVAQDPRGPDGPVHQDRKPTRVFTRRDDGNPEV